MGRELEEFWPKSAIVFLLTIEEILSRLVIVYWCCGSPIARVVRVFICRKAGYLCMGCMDD